MAKYRQLIIQDAAGWHLMSPSNPWEAVRIAWMLWRYPDRVAALVGVSKEYKRKHWPPAAPELSDRTYLDDHGNDKRDRRRKDRADDDPRIDHLFNGFDNMIANADEYGAGYLKAMRLEFGQLIASLVR